MGHLGGWEPGGCVGGEASNIDADVWDAFLLSSKPGTEEVAVGEEEEVGGVGLDGGGWEVGFFAGGGG